MPTIIANDNLEESLVDIDGQVEEVYVASMNELDLESDEDVEIESVDEEEIDQEGEGQHIVDNEETYSD